MSHEISESQSEQEYFEKMLPKRKPLTAKEQLELERRRNIDDRQFAESGKKSRITVINQQPRNELENLRTKQPFKV